MPKTTVYFPDNHFLGHQGAASYGGTRVIFLGSGALAGMDNFQVTDTCVRALVGSTDDDWLVPAGNAPIAVMMSVFVWFMLRKETCRLLFPTKSGYAARILSKHDLQTLIEHEQLRRHPLEGTDDSAKHDWW